MLEGWGVEDVDYMVVTDGYVMEHGFENLPDYSELGPVCTINGQAWNRCDDALAYAVLSKSFRDELDRIGEAIYQGVHVSQINYTREELIRRWLKRLLNR
jgi:hypothetical protein